MKIITLEATLVEAADSGALGPGASATGPSEAVGALTGLDSGTGEATGAVDGGDMGEPWGLCSGA